MPDQIHHIKLLPQPRATEFTRQIYIFIYMYGIYWNETWFELCFQIKGRAVSQFRSGFDHCELLSVYSMVR